MDSRPYLWRRRTLGIFLGGHEMIEQLKTIREFVESVHEGEWLPYVDRANTIAALTQLDAMVGEQEPVAEVMPRRIGPGHGTPEKFTYDVNWFTVDPHKWSGKLFAAPPAQQEQPTDDAILKERDEAEDFIDALLDEVLGTDRPEWTSAYGRDDALRDVQERMTALHKPMVDKAWQRFEQPQAEAVLGMYEHKCPSVTGHRGPSFVCQKAGHAVGQNSYCNECPAAPQQAEAVPSDVVRDADVEAAAKKMAEIFDYPWDFMPEKGRNTMRENVRAVLDAAIAQQKGQP